MIKVRYFEIHLNLENVEENLTEPSDLNIICIEDALTYHQYQDAPFTGKVLFWGPYANKYPWQVLTYSDATFVCIGDDDKTTIQELIQNFDKPGSWDSILGLGTKQQRPVGTTVTETIFLGNKRPPLRSS